MKHFFAETNDGQVIEVMAILRDFSLSEEQPSLDFHLEWDDKWGYGVPNHIPYEYKNAAPQTLEELRVACMMGRYYKIEEGHYFDCNDVIQLWEEEW